MRTTLDIDDDILALARSVSKGSHREKSLGSVISEFARQGIERGAVHRAVGSSSQAELDRKLAALGVVPFERNPQVPMATEELVRKLQDNEGQL